MGPIVSTAVSQSLSAMSFGLLADLLIIMGGELRARGTRPSREQAPVTRTRTSPSNNLSIAGALTIAATGGSTITLHEQHPGMSASRPNIVDMTHTFRMNKVYSG